MSDPKETQSKSPKNSPTQSSTPILDDRPAGLTLDAVCTGVTPIEHIKWAAKGERAAGGFLKRTYVFSDGIGGSYEVVQTQDLVDSQRPTEQERSLIEDSLIYGLFTRHQLTVTSIKEYRGSLQLEVM